MLHCLYNLFFKVNVNNTYTTLQLIFILLKVHQVTWKKRVPETLGMRTLSCFECDPGTICHHNQIGALHFITASESNRLANAEKQGRKLIVELPFVNISLIR
jgi:hypothetical protein